MMALLKSALAAAILTGIIGSLCIAAAAFAA